MSEEIKEKITTVTDQLQNVMNSRATVDKLIQTGTVVLVEVPKEKVEGVEPAQLSVNSPELIERMMNPVVRELDAKRNGLLNLKESLLNQLETEVLDTKTAKPKTVTKKSKKEKK